MMSLRNLLALLAIHAIGIPLAARSNGLEIRDGDGQPVAGAVVRIWMPPSGPADLASRLVPLCEAASAENGIAPCSVPRVAGAVVTVDANDFAPLVRSLTGEPLTRLVLSPGFTLEGRIMPPPRLTDVELRGAVLEASLVVEMPERKQTFSFHRQGNVGDSGKLSIRALPQSNVSIHLGVRGFLPWTGSGKPGAVFEVRLERGILLAGRVVDENRHAVKGARIADAGDGSGASSTSDGTGHFQIATRALPALLRVVAQGYRKADIKVSMADKTTSVLAVLQPGQGVIGTVFSSDRQPVERLTLSTVMEIDPYRTKKESYEVAVEHGAFRVDLPGPNVYSFRFDAAGYEPVSLSRVQIAPRTYVDLGTVLLRLGGGASGTVVDANTGDAVSGAAVELQATGSSLLRELRYGRALRSVTDSRGQFAVTGASEGSYLLRIQAARFPDWSRPLSLGADEIISMGRIALGAGAELKGRVVDRGGVPQQGLIVRFLYQSGESATTFGEATTDADGQFARVHLSPGSYTARVFSDRLLLSQPFEIGDNERETTLDLELPTVRVSGVVRRNEKPVAGGTLSLVEQLDPAERQGKIIMHGGGGAEGTTLALGLPTSAMTLDVSSSGEFMSERVPPGPMIATYVAENGRTWTRQVTVPDVTEYRMAIDLAGTSIEGVVMSEGGLAIPRAQLTLATAGGVAVAFASSTETGDFEFADLQPGTYTVMARASGYRTRRISEIAVAERSPLPRLRVVLSPGRTGTLAVHLMRSGGAPAEFIPITVLDAAGLPVGSQPTDSNGRRDFENLPPGQYSVIWADPFYGAGASDPISVDAQTDATYSKLLTPGARLAIACDSPEYELKPMDFLSVSSPSGADLAAYLSGATVGVRLPAAHGRLVLGALSPGPYQIRIGVAGVVFDRSVDARTGDVIVQVP